MAGLTKEQRAQRAAEKAAKEAADREAAEKAEADRRQAEEAAREAGAVDVEITVESAGAREDESGSSVNDVIDQVDEELSRRIADGRLSVGDPVTAVQTVRMVRDEPMHLGGPTGADVHPDEVENWSAAGWRVE